MTMGGSAASPAMRKKGKGGLIAVVVVVVLLAAAGAVGWLVIYPNMVRAQISERYVDLDKALNAKDLGALEAITSKLGVVDNIRSIPMAEQLLDAATLSMTTRVEWIELEGKTAKATVDRTLSISATVPVLNINFSKQFAGKDVDTWEKVDGEWQITACRGEALGTIANAPPSAFL